MDPAAVVAILPCDHYYSRENVFTAALASAFAIAETRPGSIVLLGAEPKAPEVEYGWIEVGKVVGLGIGVSHVLRFHEKPPLPMAEHLLRSGSLWNTFVMVGHVDAFLDLAMATMPDLLRALRAAPICSNSDADTRRVEWLYDQLDPADFSREVLLPGAKRLLALRLSAVEWNDLGDPDRVIATLLESGAELPAWVARWRDARETERTTAQRMSWSVRPVITSRSAALMPVVQTSGKSNHECAHD